MSCPNCSSPNVRVLDTRPVDEGASVRRRRACRDCGHKWVTFEIDADQLPPDRRTLPRYYKQRTRKR